MINIQYRAPNDATTLYRGIVPLYRLQSQMPLNLMETSSFDWLSVSMADIIFLQRVAPVDAINIAKIAANYNRKIWLDYDDNLLEIPRWNPTYSAYSDTVKASLRTLLSMADAISVSTQALADAFIKHTEVTVDVIPNAYPDHLIRFNKPRVPRRNVITWRGTATHTNDLAIAHDAIRASTEDFPDWHWIFFGEPPWQTLDLFKKHVRFEVVPFLNPATYLDALSSVGSTIHIVPLEDNTFNHCKSNVAWLEASRAGATVLAPNWPEWQKPGIIHYGENSFKDTLLMMMNGHYELPVHVDLSREVINDTLLLDRVNHQRKKLIESLVD